MLSKNTLRILLLAAFFIETLCITWLMKFEDLAAITSVVYFFSGIAIAKIILFLPKPAKPIISFDNKSEKIFKVFLITITCFLICFFSISIMKDNPFDYHNADMLPVIKTMDQRFLNGQWRHVYDNVPEIWGGSQPIYLPAMWLPFAPAVALNIDVRWMTVFCLIIVFAVSVLLISFKQKYSYFILVIAAMLLWWLLSEDDTHGLIGLSEEGVIILYYFLLVLALVSENIFFISILACFCVLSRYALIGWVPAFFIYLLLNKKNKQAIIFSSIGVLFFLFFFIIPFGWNAFMQLIKLPSQYVDFSKRVWQDSPETFTDYIGFAKFFGANKMNQLHQLLISLSFIVPTAFILIYHLLKKKMNFSNIPLAALKISIVIFYNFIDVPYMYLFFTSSFVSLAMVAIFIRNEKVELSN
ncbi:MAG TPA: hypothetical protein VKT28_06085 [Puia sp.]|nr:hypothetical protein [Puia sp.]